MDKKPLIVKWLAVGIILLFVGVTIASTINFNTVKASTDNDLVEVTTQACGIQGYGDTTVKLTKEQYNDLEQYLVEFRARLNQTATKRGAIPLFKEAVIELDTYGLLPKGMNVKQAQRLVTCSFYGSHVPFISRCVPSSFQPLNDLTFNAICLVAGQSTRTVFRSIPSVLLYNIGNNINNLYLSYFMYFLSIQFDAVHSRIPFCLGDTIYIGYTFHLSSGWITTIGLLGLKKTQGNLVGGLPINHFWFSLREFYPAVLGFVGLKTSVTYEPDIANEFSYLGSAFLVQINSQPPWQYETI